jgi:fatty-acyl-CoA synthase
MAHEWVFRQCRRIEAAMGRRLASHRRIGVVTPDGYLQITNRIKDVIKSGGEWISSVQLEDIIMHRAGVAECAVMGVKDPRWGERPPALIVRYEGYVARQ